MKSTTFDRRAVSHDRETPPLPPQQQAGKLPAERLIDRYVLDRIEFRVRRLTIQFDLSEDDQDDYRQDMVVELLSAFDRFDPGKSKRETFVNRVLDKFVKYAIRTRCTHQRRACDSPLGLDDVCLGFQPVVNEARAGELDEQDRRQLRLDMAPAINGMPERLQRVCRLLMEFSPAEAAERLGICRQSIYRNIAEIRRHLAAAGLDRSGIGATDSPQVQM